MAHDHDHHHDHGGHDHHHDHALGHTHGVTDLTRLEGVDAGHTLTLAGQNTFAGGVEIGAGSTLTLLGASAAGTGTVDFQGADGTLNISASAMPANMLVNFQAGDTIDISGFATSATTVSSDLRGNVTIPGADGDVTLHMPGVGANTPFNITPIERFGCRGAIDANGTSCSRRLSSSFA